MLRNVNDSFYDFVAEHCVVTRREILAEPPDAWGGRTIYAPRSTAPAPGFA
jgi:hypothetical protein